MFKQIIFFALLLVSQLSFAQSKDVAFKYKEHSVKGTFLKAENPNGTAVLIIAGSGATDRNCNNPQMKCNAYKFLVEHLAKKGISSYRYDKFGIAESRAEGMKEADFKYDENITVAKGAYELLAKQEGVKRIVILGHSEGSTIGMVLAQDVAAHKYISLVGPGYPANEILTTQFKKSIPAGPLQDLSIAYLDSLKAGQKPTDVTPMLQSFFREGAMNYLMDWFKYDPRVEIAKLQMPILVIQGDNDVQVSNDNAEALAKANTRAKKVLVKDVNHILKIAPRDRDGNIKIYNSPEMDIAEDMKKALVEFILE